MPYQPTLASVRTHPLPGWYDDAKLGIFIHWGPYSVPAYAPRGDMAAEKLIKGETSFAYTPYAEWYQNSLRIAGSPVHAHHATAFGRDFPYERFGPQFDAAMRAWDPAAWADLFAAAGARYVVLVTKHHDGFLMWDSRQPNPRLAGWQSSRDVAGELNRAVTARGLRFGVYYSSLLDWSFTKAPITSLAELVAGSDTSRAYVDYVEAHWLELIDRYQPALLWSDIGYPPGYDLPRLFARYYNAQPDGVVNDRWMQLPKILFNRPARAALNQALKRMNTTGMPKVPHCDFTTPEYTVLDRIVERKWEACRGIGNSFGFNQFEDADDYLKGAEIVRVLADAVSKNGNLLLNVGPRADGSIHPLQVAALDGLGKWLARHGEAIYGARPWQRYGDALDGGGEARYTAKGDALYVIVTKWPTDGIVRLPLDQGARVTLLATGQPVPTLRTNGTLEARLPADAPDAIPVLKITA